MTVRWKCEDCGNSTLVEVCEAKDEDGKRRPTFKVPSGWSINAGNKARCGCTNRVEISTANLSGVPVLQG